MASDACTEAGLEVAALSSETLSEIGRNLPDWWVPGNPVDLVAGLDLTIIPPVIETMMCSGEVDAVFFIFVTPRRASGLGPPHVERGLDLRQAWDMVYSQMVTKFAELHEPMAKNVVPLYVVSTLTESDPESQEAPSDGPGLAVFDTVEMGCKAITAMVAYQKRMARETEE